MGVSRFYPLRGILVKQTFAVLALFFSGFASYASEMTSEIHAHSAVVMDAASGFVIYSKNPNEPIPPASLTKLMTIHIALQEVAAKGIDIDAAVELPPESWAINQPRGSSLMWLDQGQIVSLRELILGLAVPSGNDSAVAVALNFAPSIEQFALKMNTEAHNLGLINTHFVEPSGISEENITTAMEFAKFCRVYLKLYPGNLAEYHSVKEFAYPRPKNVPAFKKHNPGTIIQGNHIGLLNKYEGVDGLKTGYIDESGYNLALTADKDGTRFIVVLLGVPADSGHRFGTINRDKDAANLLDWAYENYKTVRVKYPDFPRARVWKGRERKIDLVPADGDSLYGAFTVNKQRNASVGYKVEMVEGLTAPLEAGTVAAHFILLDSEGELARAPLVLAKSVEKGNIFKRFWDSILMFFKGIKSV